MQDITVRDCQDILQTYLNNTNFTVLNYKKSKNKLQIVFRKENEEKVRFMIKPDFKIPDLQIAKYWNDFSLRARVIKNNLVVLENLEDEGFHFPDTNSGLLDKQLILLTLNALANCHAKSNKSLEESQVEFSSPFFTKEHFKILDHFIAEYNVSCNQILNSVTPKTLHKIKSFGWLTNDTILFKNDKSNKPTECKLINLGLGCNNSPVYDVLTFIYRTTNMEGRKQYLDELLNYYYTCLEKALESESFNVKDLFSHKDEFKKTVSYLLPYIKLETACYHMMFGLDLENFLKTKSNPSALNDVVLKIFNTDKIYKQRIIDSIIELRYTIAYPQLSLEDCYTICNKLTEADYKLLKYELKTLENVNGFFGDHRRLKISIMQDNKESEHNFFVKFTPSGDAQMSIANDCGSFYKESFFYRDFIPMAHNLGINIIEKCTTPCYLVRQNEVMVFQDFSLLNYSTPENQTLSYEVVKLTIKQMAKFHAASILVEEKLSGEGTKYRFNEHYPKGLQESFFTKLENHQGAKSMKISIEAIDYEINLFPDLSTIMLTEDFKKKIQKAYEMVYELVKPSEQFRNAICHGDLWISNILMQQVEGKPTDCRFVDFQIMRYCPPVHDLLGFIYLTTDRNFRQKYLSGLVDLYYVEFSQAFALYEYNVDDIYTRQEFWDSVNYMLPQTVCQNVIYYHICVTNPELMKDYMADEETIKKIFLEDRREFIAEMTEKDPIYKRRIKETLMDLKEMCEKYF